MNNRYTIKEKGPQVTLGTANLCEVTANAENECRQAIGRGAVGGPP